MRDFICQYNNCRETETPILLSINNTDPKERVRFCSTAHLALWARTKAHRNANLEARLVTLTEEETKELGL